MCSWPCGFQPQASKPENGAPAMATRILVVDDQRPIADTLCEILCAVGYDCSAVYSGKEALERVQEWKPALLITDVIMPDVNGIDLLKRVEDVDPGCAVLLCSGNAATQDLLLTAQMEGKTFRVLAKPVPPRELLETVTQMLDREHRS